MRKRKRIVVALAGALLLVAALIAVLVVAGESGSEGEHAQEHERLGRAVDGDEAGGGGELGRATRTSPAGYPRLYDSQNTDGKAGSGAMAIAYQSGGRAVALPASKLPQARLWRTGHGGWEPTFGLNER